MYLKLIAAIGDEPVTLEQAKKHLRVVGNHDDSLIELLISAAREAAENYINQAILKVRYEQTGDSLKRSFELLKHPVNEIESVIWGEYHYEYTDYYIRNTYLHLPVVEGLEPALNAAKVTYTAGYDVNETENKVPKSIIAAIMLIMGNLYENRESTLVGVSAIELPMGATFLLNPYRMIMV